MGDTVGERFRSQAPVALAVLASPLALDRSDLASIHAADAETDRETVSPLDITERPMMRNPRGP